MVSMFLRRVDSEKPFHAMGVVLELADVGSCSELVRAQRQQYVLLVVEVAAELCRKSVVLDVGLAGLDGHHEFGPQQTAGLEEGLHVRDEFGERAVMVGTVMPGAACPDGVALRLVGVGLQEVLFHDLRSVMEARE
jgi:hypothetical protein